MAPVSNLQLSAGKPSVSIDPIPVHAQGLSTFLGELDQTQAGPRPPLGERGPAWRGEAV